MRTLIDEEVTKAIEWVYESYGQVPFHVKQGFDREVRHPEWTRRLLDALGAPDVTTYNVAVTGSKGKGTHAILLAAILQRAGLRVGLFTSPHLVDFLERIRVDGRPIDSGSFVRLCGDVRQVTSRMKLPESHYFGPVGLLATVASLWFREQATDVNVFELGRGAKHDDVNQVYHQGAILTPVFTEHVDKLGPSFFDIVQEKLGVFTEGTKWMVAHEQAPDCLNVLYRLRQAREADIETLAVDFNYRCGPLRDDEGAVETSTAKFGRIQATVPAQIMPYASNIAVALQAATRVLNDVQRLDAENGLSANLRGLDLPGRLQVVRAPGKPTCVIDGTIHEQSARLVAEWVRRAGRFQDVWALLSLPDDKDGTGVLRQIGPLVNHLWFTQSANHHLIYSKDWNREARVFASDVRTVTGVEVAVARLNEVVRAEDLILFLGTQSYVGEVLRNLRVPTGSIWSNLS